LHPVLVLAAQGHRGLLREAWMYQGEIAPLQLEGENALKRHEVVDAM
jgi:hypothetical protein